MKILAIAGSARRSSRSGCYRLVSAVLENTGEAFDLVHLADKLISGCIVCLGCVKDNVCKVDDDLAALREQIVAVDAGRLLGDRLREGHDRQKVIGAMQKKNDGDDGVFGLKMAASQLRPVPIPRIPVVGGRACPKKSHV